MQLSFHAGSGKNLPAPFPRPHRLSSATKFVCTEEAVGATPTQLRCSVSVTLYAARQVNSCMLCKN